MRLFRGFDWNATWRGFAKFASAAGSINLKLWLGLSPPAAEATVIGSGEELVCR